MPAGSLSVAEDLARAWGILPIDLTGLALMAGPFLAGFIAGYVLKRGLKLVLLLGLALLILEYGGYTATPRLADFLWRLAEKYGSQALALLLALNHVGIGFAAGFVAALILT